MICRTSFALLTWVLWTISPQLNAAVAQTTSLPEWYFSPPSDPNYLYSASSAQLLNPALSYIKASTLARDDLAQIQQARLDRLRDEFMKEATAGDSSDADLLALFAPVTKMIYKQDLVHSQVEEVHIDEKGRVYVLTSLPLGSTWMGLMEKRPVERDPIGLGLGVDTVMANGTRLDARTMAAWSARLDLSQMVWAHVSGLRKQFMEETESDELLQSFSLVTKIQTRILPAELVEITEMQPKGNGVWQARARLRPELLSIKDPAEFASLQTTAVIKNLDKEAGVGEDFEVRSFFEFLGYEYHFKVDSDSLQNTLIEPIARVDHQRRIKDWARERGLSMLFEGTDTTPPEIQITAPAGVRGLKKSATEEKSIVLRGIAFDASGVFEVIVNDAEAHLQADGSFQAEVLLALGDNIIQVRATDTRRNTTTREFTIVRRPSAATSFISGRYFALIIGIDQYKGTWPSLQNAVRDAKAVEEALREDFRFDAIITLYDHQATRAAIIQRFEKLAEVIVSDDNLMIYYSGHGDFKEQLNKGYWVPIDATTASTAGYISNSDIQTFLGGIAAKHTLLISDACFAGDIFRGKTESIPFANNDRYYQEVYRRLSRQAIASGGLQPVMDGGRDGHSVFTYYLLKALKSNPNQYFDAGQLFNELKIPVANNSVQTPMFSPVKNTGDEGGQFLFMRK